MRAVFPALLLLSLSLPAAAQEIDFGDDASPFANDGQCDDSRFVGPGMTSTPLLVSDIRHDATDCRLAWEAGLLQLAEGASEAQPVRPGPATAPEPAPAPATPPQNGFSLGGLGKTDRVRDGGSGSEPVRDLVVAGILFGDDSGTLANDGRCDDRRFFGSGMADEITWASTGRDASDCSAAYLSGQIQLWDEAASMAATSCQAIDFGDDSGEYPRDGECDDYRFEGRGVAMRLSRATAGQDASDCAQLCRFGMLGLREY